MFQSNVVQGGPVAFPEFTGERVYMRAFTKAEGLPADLRRWQDTVDQMLDGVDASGPVYLMVDQAPVRAGLTHRRPGAHVDGYWDPGYQCHGQQPTPPAHRPRPPSHGGHRGRHSRGSSDAELLLLATDVLGCEAYVGAVEGTPSAGGDCSALDLGGLTRVDFAPGRVWAGHTLNMLHASVPHRRDCLRTVVRLNVPGAATP